MNQRDEAINPGIVVLSSSLQCLHLNRRAVTLLTQLERSGSRAGTDWNLTAPLHPLCHDIIATLRERLALRNFTPFYRYHAVGNSEQELLLKGFGLPDRNGLSHSRIVLLLSSHVGSSLRAAVLPKTAG